MPARTDRGDAPTSRRSVDLEDLVVDGEIDTEDIEALRIANEHTRLAVQSEAGGSKRHSAAYVGIEGFVARSVTDTRDEYGGMLVIQVPLDRLAEGRILPFPPPTAALATATSASIGPVESATASDTTSRKAVASSARPGPDGSAGAPLAPLPSAVVRGCVRAGLRASGLAEGDARLDRIAGRARTAAWLPELRIRGVRTDDASSRLTLTDVDTGRYIASGGATNLLEARMTWRLDRLIFADEEVALERIRVARAEAHARVVHQVVASLSSWADARALVADPALSGEERRRAELRLAAAAAALDALTDGCLDAVQSGPAATVP